MTRRPRKSAPKAASARSDQDAAADTLPASTSQKGEEVQAAYRARRPRKSLREAASARSDQDAAADTTPPAPAPPEPPQRGEEADAPTGQRTRLTVYLPLESYETLAAVALQRKVRRGGRGHASVSRLVLDLIEERLPELTEELGR